MDCDLAKTFLESLKLKINKRRNLHIVSLLNFLHNPDSFYLKNNFLITNCSKSSLISYTEEIYHGLFATPDSPKFQSIQNENEINKSVDDNATIPFELQLEKAIKEVSLNKNYIESQQKS